MKPVVTRRLMKRASTPNVGVSGTMGREGVGARRGGEGGWAGVAGGGG